MTFSGSVCRGSVAMEVDCDAADGSGRGVGGGGEEWDLDLGFGLGPGLVEMWIRERWYRAEEDSTKDVTRGKGSGGLA